MLPKAAFLILFTKYCVAFFRDLSLSLTVIISRTSPITSSRILTVKLCKILEAPHIVGNQSPVRKNMNKVVLMLHKHCSELCIGTGWRQTLFVVFMEHVFSSDRSLRIANVSLSVCPSVRLIVSIC